jgi:hypothetical protein
MKPEFNPGRQAAEVGIDQQGDAALGQRADLGEHEREEIAREGHGFGVKVSAA